MKASKARHGNEKRRVRDLPDELFLVQVESDDGRTANETLSFTRSPTVLLTFAANRFTRAAARAYQERYGVGAMDWRMLVMLTREPGATLARSAEVIGIDKGAVSRSLRRLQEKKLAACGDLHRNGRSRGWRLTRRGKELHDKILADALHRQRRLLDGFDVGELAALCDMLRRILKNLETL